MENQDSRGHYLPLDGIRGIAILGVFGLHYAVFPRVTQWGWAGVDLFFTLSGFLITGILFDSISRPRYFRDFYIRRALRIFPLYGAFWVGVACMIPILHLQWSAGYWAWLTYVGNSLPALALHKGMDPDFYTNFAFHTADGSKRFIVVGHFWTLCVEEQFYLLWPIVIYFVRDRRMLMKVCLGAIVACIIARLLLPGLMSESLRNTDFAFKLMPLHIDGLMLGSFLALWMRGEKGISSIRASWVYTSGLVAMAGLMLSAKFLPQNQTGNYLSPWVQSYGLTLIAIVSAAIIFAAIASSRVGSLLSWKPLVVLGRISYGFYILHWLPAAIWHPPNVNRVGRTFHAIVYFSVTFIASWLSFKYFESPFLRLKDRFAPKSLTRETVLREEEVPGEART